MASPRITTEAAEAAEKLTDKERFELVKRRWLGEKPKAVAESAGIDYRTLLGWASPLEAAARRDINSGKAHAPAIAKGYGLPTATVEGWCKPKAGAKAKRNAKPKPKPKESAEGWETTTIEAVPISASAIRHKDPDNPFGGKGYSDDGVFNTLLASGGRPGVATATTLVSKSGHDADTTGTSPVGKRRHDADKPVISGKRKAAKLTHRVSEEKTPAGDGVATGTSPVGKKGHDAEKPVIAEQHQAEKPDDKVREEKAPAGDGVTIIIISGAQVTLAVAAMVKAFQAALLGMAKN